MNELLAFFSTYKIDWTQTSLLGFGILAVVGIASKAVFGKKKKHWTESKHESEVVKPVLAQKSLNYDSVMTADVDRLINPRYAIDEDDGELESEFKLETPSKDSAIEVSSAIKLEEIFTSSTSQIEQHKSEPVVEYDFLDMLTAQNNHSNDTAIVAAPTYQPPSIELIVPELTEVVGTDLISPEVYSKIPTLTEVYTPSPQEQFIPIVKSEVDEEQFPLTKKYHSYIEEALVYDQQNNKEQALISLKTAGTLIENVRINFYLKVAIQSYTSSVIQNALPSIINQFYIIEKEKLMKEKQKEQEAINQSVSQSTPELPLVNPISLVQPVDLNPPLWETPIENTFVPETLPEILPNNEIIYSSNYSPEVLPSANDAVTPLNTEFNEQKSEEIIYSPIDSAVGNNESLMNSNNYQQDTTYFEPKQPESVPLEISKNSDTVKSSIDNEFEDEETKNQFLNAFGNMFTPDTSEKDNEMSLEITLPAKKNSTVWVNWILSKNGKMNFKNNIVELNSVWCTKVSVEELNSYLEGLAGEGSQFMVISVQNVKS